MGWAWPPARAAASNTTAAGAAVHTQRWAPNHSVSCSPGKPKGAAVGGTDTRHKVTRPAGPALPTAARAPWKNSSLWSRTPCQNGSAEAGAINSPWRSRHRH